MKVVRSLSLILIGSSNARFLSLSLVPSSDVSLERGSTTHDGSLIDFQFALFHVGDIKASIFTFSVRFKVGCLCFLKSGRFSFSTKLAGCLVSSSSLQWNVRAAPQTSEKHQKCNDPDKNAYSLFNPESVSLLTLGASGNFHV